MPSPTPSVNTLVDTTTRVTAPVVSIGSVTKVFPRGSVAALEDVSFDVARGQFVALVGPSGCGKSTILRLVAGLIPKTSGRVMVHGADVSGPRPDTAMMFQRPILLPWKTALENVVVPRRIRGGSVGEAARGEARELLDFVGLGKFHHAYPQQLSGGMQQRVALARLLVTGADLLLMDEPFSALDEFARERLGLELLRIQARVNATVMFVTHSIPEAVFLADRVVVLTPSPGRLADVVDVPFGRPRTIDMTRTSEFGDVVFRVRELLGESI